VTEAHTGPYFSYFWRWLCL